jgi:4-nitrophenyl phosphatase
MIGDRLDTDIAFGNNGGLTSLLVLTGINKRSDFEQPGAPVVPRLVVGSLGDLALIA